MPLKPTTQQINAAERGRTLNTLCRCGNHAVLTKMDPGDDEHAPKAIHVCLACFTGVDGGRAGVVYEPPRKRRSVLRAAKGKGSPGWQNDSFRGHTKKRPRSKTTSTTLSRAALARRTPDNPYGLTERQLEKRSHA